MLVSQKHKTLILNPSHPDQLLAAMEGAKRAKKDPKYIMVKHTPDNVAKLRSLGYKKTPSPVIYDYDWPGRFSPFKHQMTTVSFLTGSPRGFVLSGLGSGKTNAALWAADYLMHQRLIGKVLIVSPLSTLERVWGDTIFADFFHRKAAVLYGTSEKRLKLFRDRKYDFYIINPDGFSIIATEFKDRKDINCVILDEASSYRNISTTRFQLMRSCLKANVPRYLWMMTGTPTPNAPTDAWGMAAIMGDTKGFTSTGFRDATMYKASMYRWLPRPQSEKLVHQLLTPAVRFKTSDCIDLPPTIYQTRQTELSKTQLKIYRDMVNKMVADVGSNTINAVNEADKQNKLLQIICGFVYGVNDNNERETTRVEAGPRIGVLKELLEEIEGKAIIFVPYVELIRILYEAISPHYSVEIVDGQTASSKRNVIFKDFQETDRPRLLLAHPKTMAHGLTLTSAATVIWYAPYASNEIYEQANGRIVRPSQTRTTNIIHIEATTLERKLYERLKNRQKTQGLLLEYIQNKEM